MNVTPGKRIFRELERRGIRPSHVMEVGVYFPETSNVYDWIEAGVRATLVEPDPASIARIRERFAGHANVELHPVAIVEEPGPVRLVQRNASTFLSTVASSPALVNDGYRLDEADTFEVLGVRCDAVDDGTVDVLSVDVEGSEWGVIQGLRSRPAVISVETHGAAYVNPHWSDIHAWMEREGYAVWYRDRTDTVFARRSVITPNRVDRLRLWAMNGYLALRRQRKRLSRRLKRRA